MENFKILSFNASFEAMLGKENINPGRYRIFNEYKYTQKRVYKNKTYEHGNIPTILDIKESLEIEHEYEDFDFIAIQEATCFSEYRLDKKCSKEFVFKDSPILDTMNIFTHIEDMDYLVTLYSKKLSTPEIVSGAIVKSKPYTLLNFKKEKIIFINIHNEYGNGIENMKNVLSKKLTELINKETIKDYLFIITGDINDESSSFELSIHGFPIVVSEPKTFATCCFTTDGEKVINRSGSLTRHYDHIYSNKKIQKYRAFDILNFETGDIISDHRPIKGIIKNM
jgi:hypothetical protein